MPGSPNLLDPDKVEAEKQLEIGIDRMRIRQGAAAQLSAR
jgi:hypothetical protein